MRALKPCGTHAAFVRHWARSEQPCQPCVDAERLYQRDRFRRSRQSADQAVPPQVATSHTLGNADQHLRRCRCCGEWAWHLDPCTVCRTPAGSDGRAVTRQQQAS